ncbi:MarR family winged helix-turn-helix transcriptional regulator [Clostridium sp. MT-14]|jgi:DNA-binding MarR family transcriptional regulator|uniref:Transcriptional repressor MprA n=2 Tax=Clostridium luticellarii TaxID=1691940 RepID=A0A2T0BQ03_9CLOT|nr:MarR family transcriptional regulator [Clostridium luticellarii]PRR85922.1 Transcriptional repressor MprA [Clostridium luticellarii]
MQIDDMIKNYSGEREKETRGIFASIFILQNRLQTIFDKADPFLTLKQFMLLVMIKHTTGKTTFTHLGKLSGSSRQNIKKLAASLEKKGFITIRKNPVNKRNTSIQLTEKGDSYFEEVFYFHNEKLNSLFHEYSDEEIHLFYTMITRLYAGVDSQEQKYK